METTTALVLNQKLHLMQVGHVERCAGKRYGRPVVEVTCEYTPDGNGISAAWLAASKAAREQMAPQLTDAQLANLCEKCAGHLARFAR